MEFMQFLTPELITKLSESGVLIIFLIFLFIFVSFIYKSYIVHKEKIHKENLELKRLEIEQLEKANAEKYKREDEHRALSSQMLKQLEETRNLNKFLYNQVDIKEQQIQKMFNINKEHRFKIIKHVKNAKNETEIILQCPNCKKNGEFVIEELNNIESTAEKGLNNE